jgi:flagellar motor protein MotB
MISYIDFMLALICYWVVVWMMSTWMSCTVSSTKREGRDSLEIVVKIFS